MNKIAWLLARSGYMEGADGEGNDLPGGAGAEGDDKGAGAADADKDAGSADADADKDAGSADADADKDAGAKKEFHVPKSRMDAATARATREKERADNLQIELDKKNGSGAESSATAAPSSNAIELESSLIELDDKLDAAIADGKTDEARNLRNQIRTTERKINQAYVNEATANASTAARSGSRADTLLAQYESEYPEINPDSESYNADKDTEVAELKQAFMASGTPEPEALAKAVTYAMGAAGGAGDAGGESTARTTDVDKNIDTHTRQPGKMSGKDNGDMGMHKGLDPMNMSDEEFDKLTPEQLSDLRGDTVKV